MSSITSDPRSRRTMLANLGAGAFAIATSRLGAFAQEASPVAEQGAGLDLAAMALAPDDVPEGMFDTYSERWVPAAAFSALVLEGEATPAALEQVYQSYYFNVYEQFGLHIHLYQFPSAQEAAAGIGIVDAATLRPSIASEQVAEPLVEPGPELGEGSSATTRITYFPQIQFEDVSRIEVVASTFQRDRLIAGVSVERYIAPLADGSPMAVAEESRQADAELAVEMARNLDERVTSVMSGGLPTGVDLSLSAMVLPVEQLGDARTPVWGGYKSGVDLLRCGICGEFNSLAPFADDTLGGFTRIVSVSPLVDGQPQPPVISVAITAFTSPAVALEVLEAMRLAPNDRPTPGPTSRGERSLVADPMIPETTATLGFEAVSDTEDPNAAIDSAGVTLVADSWLVSVDVQGGLSGDAALAVAVDLATQQSDCLATGGHCEELTVPNGL